MPHDDRRNTSWHDVWPGLGLAIGAGLGLVVALLVSTASVAVVTGMAVGAGLGLIVGAVVRAAARPGPDR